MLGHKKFLPCLLYVIFTSSSLASTTAFTINSLTSQATVSSVGQTSVHYTITSNATGSIPNISVNQSQGSSGRDLSLSNDNCSGVTLTPNSNSCSFDISVNGNSQTSGFSLQPWVCGFNGMLCSQPASSTSISLIEHRLPLRIYEIVFTPYTANEEYLVGINIANTSDVIRAPISAPTADGALVTSPDGSKIYVTHKNPDNSYSILIFSVTTNSLTELPTSYALSYQGENLNSPGQIAITPDGSTLYITDYLYSGSGYPVFKVDLNSGTVTGLSDATTGNLIQSPRSLAISPDGITVYMSNSIPSGDDPTCKIFQFTNSTSTNSINTVLTTNLDAISTIFISSDGSKLYVGGQIPTGNFPAALSQYNITQGLTLENTFTPTPAGNGNIVGAALSPDNAIIYTVAYNNDDFYLYKINTANMTAATGMSYPKHIYPFQGNFNFIAWSPDNSTIAILNYGSDGNLTSLFPPSSPDSVTTANPAPSGGTLISSTRNPIIN